MLARPEIVGEEQDAVVAELGMIERAPPLIRAGLLADRTRGRLERSVEGFKSSRERVIDEVSADTALAAAVHDCELFGAGNATEPTISPI